jgi:hypothetical protein
MYCLAPEKALRLVPQGHFLRGVYEPFYLAIHVTFYETINHEFTDQELNSVSVKFFSKLSENIRNATIIYGDETYERQGAKITTWRHIELMDE